MVVASARSRRSPSTSASLGSAFARSRPGQCRSCGTRRPTSAPASSSKPSDPYLLTRTTAVLRGGRFLFVETLEHLGEGGVGAGLRQDRTAVDDECLPGDVAGAVGSEEQDRF